MERAVPHRGCILGHTNKLMPFLTSRQLRAITSPNGRPSLDLRRVMDEQKILIVNLSRGLLGQDNSTLLGSLLLTGIEQAAMTRADLPDELAARLARTLHGAEAALCRKLAQACETTAMNTLAAAPKQELIHPGVMKYLRETGMAK